MSSQGPHLTPSPLFTTFYIQHPDLGHSSPLDSPADWPTNSKTYILPPPLSPALPLPDIADAAATHAEAVFWEIIRVLQDDAIKASHTLEIPSFWPPLNTGDESEQEDW